MEMVGKSTGSQSHKPDNGVFISTYGCQMNDNDSERMYSLLEMMNYVPVQTPDQASLIIINSCSVREKPVHKVHSEAGRYRKLKEKNPHLRIGVGGCVGQQEKGRLLKDVPVLDFVFGTDSIDKLPQIVEKVTTTDERVVDAKFEHQRPYQIQTMNRNPGVSTFVNITKGCDNFCTFCVVPFTRGRERSRAMSALIEDVKGLVKRGVKEVTLLGQNVNSYKSECGADFGQMMKAIVEETDIKRIRYTTSHPKDFNEELVDIQAKYGDVIVPYIHLPVQSGNSEVLERMNRGYTREEYIAKAKMILEKIPNVSLSTDIIVGFPGETNEQFEETLSLLEEVPYESIFAFKYSPRPFTKAARFEDQVPEKEKSERLQRLFDTHNEMAFKFAERYVNQVVPVLVEEYDDKTGKHFGRNPQNKCVYFTGGENLVGQIVPVKITTAFPQTLRGELVSE